MVSKEGRLRAYKAFIRGEVAAGSAKVARATQWDKRNIRTGWSGSQERIRGQSGSREFRRSMRTCVPYARRETFTPLTKTSKEILVMDIINFTPPPPLIRTLEKQKLNKFCDYHRDRGHNTNDCYHLKKQIEEAVALGKLAHLINDIPKGNQRNRGQGRGSVKVINMVGSGENRKRPYETEEPRESLEGMQTNRGNIKFIERDAVAAIHGANVKDKRESHIMEPKHRQPKARKGAYGIQRILGGGYEASGNPSEEWGCILLDISGEHGCAPVHYGIPIESGWHLASAMDFTSLKKVCPKYMYPFPKIKEKLGSLTGHRYKCLLWIPMEGSSVRMSEDDEE
ncbi:hypothetical protein Tco_1388904 [Tanacetum coccineum]